MSGAGLRQAGHQILKILQVIIQGLERIVTDGDVGRLNGSVIPVLSKEVVGSRVGPKIDRFSGPGPVREENHPLPRGSQGTVEFGVGIGQPLNRSTVPVHHTGFPTDIDQ